ncbi:MAG TPA: hypothetical protein VK114_01790, partial [Nitrososphaerales archaeon]|nr:hypothetical protein [Nitrososphaerales archaeon]
MRSPRIFPGRRAEDAVIGDRTPPVLVCKIPAHGALERIIQGVTRFPPQLSPQLAVVKTVPIVVPRPVLHELDKTSVLAHQ